MNQLIWFSIPGVYVVAAFYGWIKIPQEQEFSVFINVGSVGLAVFFGFVIHQFWRAVFECILGSWQNKFRKVIDIICDAYGFEPKSEDHRHRAFLIWELSLYSGLIPEPFRTHIRDSWHYVMSFASCQIAALICLGSHFIEYIYFQHHVQDKWLMWISFISLVIFFFKSTSTYREINNQECRAFRLYYWVFDSVHHDRIRPLVDATLKTR